MRSFLAVVVMSAVVVVVAILTNGGAQTEARLLGQVARGERVVSAS
jgi:hypothetical protein